MGLYPPLDLMLSVPGLKLRLMRDPEIERLATRAVGAILAPGDDEFLNGWARVPSPHFERNFLAHQWLQRASITRARWTLNFGVFPDEVGAPIGVQSLSATSFPELGVVTTGSWLLRDHQGRGIGARMRSIALEFAFGTLGARAASTSAHLDNLPSQGVSRRLGYREVGYETDTGDGRTRPVIRFRLDASEWRAPEAVQVTGAEELLPMLGALPR